LNGGQLQRTSFKKRKTKTLGGPLQKALTRGGRVEGGGPVLVIHKRLGEVGGGYRDGLTKSGNKGGVPPKTRNWLGKSANIVEGGEG